jgi:transcriptional regulator
MARLELRIDYARVVQLREQGLTFRVIAQRMGCSTAGVANALKAKPKPP